MWILDPRQDTGHPLSGRFTSHGSRSCERQHEPSRIGHHLCGCLIFDLAGADVRQAHVCDLDDGSTAHRRQDEGHSRVPFLGGSTIRDQVRPDVPKVRTHRYGSPYPTSTRGFILPAMTDQTAIFVALIAASAGIIGALVGSWIAARETKRAGAMAHIEAQADRDEARRARFADR